MKKVFNSVWVTFEKEGIHCYPAAGTDEKLADVAFLQYPHRHLFKFKVRIEVFTDDRDIEFILFKRWLESLYSEGTLQLDHKSCEMLADDLASQIMKQYPGRHLTIDVSEDGENGSYSEYEPKKIHDVSLQDAYDDTVSKLDSALPDLNITPDAKTRIGFLASLFKH